MLSGQSHYTSTFTDLYVEETPIAMGRYAGMKGFNSMNDQDLGPMNVFHSTFSLRAKFTLLPYFMNSAAGCAYVTSISSPDNKQWLYNFWYEPITGSGGVHFGTRVTPVCTCSTGLSMSCTITLDFMSSDSTVVGSYSFTLSRQK